MKEAKKIQKSKKQPQTRIAEWKKKEVEALKELMKKKSVIIVSIKNLPAAQFQEIKKKLRGRALIKVAKNNLLDFALEHAKNDALSKLVKYINADVAILFSDEDVFEISAFLSENKSPAKAKEGQESPEDIEIKSGPTSLMPGPDISALSAVGLQPKVENGKISIVKDKVLCKKGEKINSAKASILAKLDIAPFKVGLEPVIAYMNGKIYADIKIDKEATLEELKESAGRSIAFAVSINYICSETLPFIFGKALSHENAISSFVKETPEVNIGEQK